jgi:hypothetical protein
MHANDTRKLSAAPTAAAEPPHLRREARALAAFAALPVEAVNDADAYPFEVWEEAPAPAPVAAPVAAPAPARAVNWGSARELREFLDTVFDNLASDPYPEYAITLANRKTRGPGKMDTYPGRALPVHPRARIDLHRLYVSSASCIVEDRGEAAKFLSRKNENLAFFHCVIADDINTKASAPPLAATWEMETSPDNFQFGYKIEPVRATPENSARVAAVYRALIAGGWGDPGVTSACRLFRVPGSVNGKPGTASEYHDFAARLATWRPEATYTLESLEAAFGVEKPTAQTPAASVGGPVRAAGDGGGSAWEENILRGVALHDSLLRLSASMAARGAAREVAIETLRGLMDRSAAPRDARWQARYDAIEGAVDTAMAKFAPANANEAPGGAARRDEALHQRTRAEAAAIGEGLAFTPLAEVMSCEQMLARLVFLSEGPRVADLQNPRRVLTASEATAHFAASVDWVPGGKAMKRVQRLKVWMESPARRTVTSLTFAPGKPLFTLDPAGKECLNTFTGFDDRGETVPESALLWIEHVRWLFRDRGEDVLDFFAHIEQLPGVLVNRAWLHVSDHQGTGRNLLASMLARVWACHVALCVDMPTILGGGFNGQLAGKLLAVVDEINESGSERWAHAEAFKTLITAQARKINPKYGRESIEFNVLRWLMFSNSREALPVGDADRRVEVVVNPEPPRAQAYYDRLAATLDDPETVRGVGLFLRRRDIGAFNPGAHAARTEDKAQLVRNTRSPMASALADFLDEAGERELFLMGEIELVVGQSSVGAGAGRVKAAMEACGLLRLGRYRVSGRQVMVYTRKGDHEKWKAALIGSGAGELLEAELPCRAASAAFRAEAALRPRGFGGTPR